MSEEAELPSIGDLLHGQVLVCKGDDQPEEWDDWLKSLVDEFEWLESTASEHDLEVHTGSDPKKIEGWSDFCEAVGVDIRTQFWEGSMISGQFVMGWIKAGDIRGAKKAGETMLKKIRKNLLKQLRERTIKELNKIDDLDTLIERTRDDRASLLAEIGRLRVAVADTQDTMTALKQAVAEAKMNDTSALDLDCLRLAGAVLNRERVKLLAGPLVFWDDGVVYAFTSRGGVPLPDDSSPSVLLKQLQRSGHPIVAVGEMTVISGWLSGPHYRKGTAHISGWGNVWREVEQNRERKFLVTDPGQLPTVRAIHDHFKTPLMFPKEPPLIFPSKFHA